MRERRSRRGRPAGRLGRASVLLGIGLACACAGSAGPPTAMQPRAARQHPALTRGREAPAPAGMAGDSAERKLSLGDRQLRSGAPERALWSYIEAHRLDPENPEPRERIAFLHLEREPDRAQSIFEEVLEERPDSVDARLGLGLAQLARGRVEEARASLEVARSMAPDSVAVLSALGAVYDRLGRPVAAQAQLQRAHRLEPRNARILNNLGVSYLLGGEFVRAEEALRKATHLDGRDVAARNNLGLALGMLERYDEALKVFRQAGSEQAAQNNLGYVYYLNGRHAKALRHYEEALLAEGDQKLVVLNNIALARAAQQQAAQSPEPAQPEAAQPEAVQVEPAQPKPAQAQPASSEAPPAGQP